MALDVSDKNYLPWTLGIEIYLDIMGLGDTIRIGNEASNQEHVKTLIFIHHHLHESLKGEYLTIKDPLILWQNLKGMYEYQKLVILPKARYDWMHLCLQDFKTVSEYNSALHKISSQLKHYGENITDDDMMEITFSTFHALNVLHSSNIKRKGSKKYFDVIHCPILAELNNKLLMKNHESRPTGSTPFSKVNTLNHIQGRGCGRGRVHYHGHDGGNNNYGYQQTQTLKSFECLLFRCGMKGNWSCTCRVPKHFVELYQASLKRKNKEVNLVHLDNDNVEQYLDVTHFDVAGFFDVIDGSANTFSTDEKDHV